MCDGRRCSQGFCGARAALDVTGKNRSDNGISGRRNRPAAGTAFGSDDGGTNTSDESSRGGGNAVNPYTWLMWAKIVKIGRRGGVHPRNHAQWGARAHPRQCLW